MTTVAIVGAGDIGGATAQALAASDGIDRILLIDANAKAAAGKALDLQQAGAISAARARLEGTDDVSRVIGCSACIIADAFADGSPEWNGNAALATLARLSPMLATAPIVFAGAQHTNLMELVARELGTSPLQLIGSAPLALVSALRALVALEASCSPAEVSLSVLGRPPHGLVVPWSDASVGGYNLERRLAQVQLARLESRLDHLWPPGPYTLGLAAARIGHAIASSSRRSYPVLAVLDGLFGARGVAGIVHAHLSARGIASTVEPSLSGRDSVRVQTALRASSEARG